jgi:hypothetical protein
VISCKVHKRLISFGGEEWEGEGKVREGREYEMQYLFVTAICSRDSGYGTIHHRHLHHQPASTASKYLHSDTPISAQLGFSEIKIFTTDQLDMGL